MSVWTSTMNLRSTGNSEKKNRKWPKLAMLATGALLLSAISFIGVGAIPQPQAFAQNVEQSEANIGSQTATAAGNITQSSANIADQIAQATGNVDQSLLNDVDQFANSTGP
jgi:hypothetical protein